MRPVLIVGGTGNVGRHVVDRLAAVRASFRVMSRNPDAAGLPASVEVVRGDLAAPEILDSCLRNIGARRIVFLTAPLQTPHRSSSSEIPLAAPIFARQSPLTAPAQARYPSSMSSRAAERRPLPSLGQHAEANLRFIRRTMERSSTFTAVPGLGGAGMGAVGIAASLIAANQASTARWLLVWLAAAAVALTLGVTAMLRKAARTDAPLTGAPGRRFVLSLAPPFAAGAALTWGLWVRGDTALMPPVWLLLYGTGVLAGGAFSIAAVRLLGLAFMGLGIAALVTEPAWGNLWLSVGFGGLQLAFGLYIARRHGG
jgi:NAD(P)-dependent dehydrogenase (short-subunit alcohol dehydrogenase family)